MIKILGLIIGLGLCAQLVYIIKINMQDFIRNQRTKIGHKKIKDVISLIKDEHISEKTGLSKKKIKSIRYLSLAYKTSWMNIQNKEFNDKDINNIKYIREKFLISYGIDIHFEIYNVSSFDAKLLY